MQNSTARVLVVDDEEYNLRIISHHLKGDNFEVVTAVNGLKAWNLLNENPETFDAILLDRSMPVMTGMEVLAKIKSHSLLKKIPVIFQTALTHNDEILEGLRAGAYYYLTKPYNKEDLKLIVNSAIADSTKHQKLQNETSKFFDAFACIKKGEFEIKTPKQGEQLSALLSSACPKPEKIVVGLWELILNGIEHGNLGISYEEKSQLCQQNEWIPEINRRLSQKEHKKKSVKIQMNRYENAIEFIIKDNGNGFDWHNYLDLSPQRAFDSHGRGIAIACTYSFDSVEYFGTGNIVSAIVSLKI